MRILDDLDDAAFDSGPSLRTASGVEIAYLYKMTHRDAVHEPGLRSPRDAELLEQRDEFCSVPRQQLSIGKAQNSVTVCGEAGFSDSLITEGVERVAAHGVLLRAVQLAEDDPLLALSCEVRAEHLCRVDGAGKRSLQLRQIKSLLDHDRTGDGFPAALGPPIRMCADGRDALYSSLAAEAHPDVVAELFCAEPPGPRITVGDRESRLEAEPRCAIEEGPYGAGRADALTEA